MIFYFERIVRIFNPRRLVSNESHRKSQKRKGNSLSRGSRSYYWLAFGFKYHSSCRWVLNSCWVEWTSEYCNTLPTSLSNTSSIDLLAKQISLPTLGDSTNSSKLPRFCRWTFRLQWLSTSHTGTNSSTWFVAKSTKLITGFDNDFD